MQNAVLMQQELRGLRWKGENNRQTMKKNIPRFFIQKGGILMSTEGLATAQEYEETLK